MGNGHSLTEYRRAAEILWGDAGAYAVDEYERLNAAYFAGELPPLPIVIGLTAYGRTVGLCRHTGPWSGGLPRITLAPKTFAAGALEVTEVLLHEMIHARLILAGLDSGHNSRPWCAEVERLSPLVLGASVKAAPVVPRRVDGKVVRRPLDGHLGRKQLAGWPQALRSPAELGARGRPIPVPTY
jgi:SprT-like family